MNKYMIYTKQQVRNNHKALNRRLIMTEWKLSFDHTRMKMMFQNSILLFVCQSSNIENNVGCTLSRSISCPETMHVCLEIICTVGETCLFLPHNLLSIKHQNSDFTL